MKTASFRVNAPMVASQTIDGEAILIHFESGAYYSAGRAGGLVIGWLEAGHSVDDVVRHWGESSGGASVVDGPVRAFVAELERENLIVPRPDTDAPLTTPLTAAGDGPFEAPVLQKFDDLQDILLLDPIHDGEHPAWPVEQTGRKQADD